MVRCPWFAVLALLGCARPSPPPVQLGEAGKFAVLAQGGWSVTPPGTITGESGDGSAAAALSDMRSAFDDAAGRSADITALDEGRLLARTVVTSVYRWDAGLRITEELKLDGSATDVWLFQIPGDLVVGSNVKMLLIGDPPLASNIIWQVGGNVTIGDGARFEGTVLSAGSITVGAGASLHGRALSQATVHVDGGSVLE